MKNCLERQFEPCKIIARNLPGKCIHLQDFAGMSARILQDLCFSQQGKIDVV